MPSAQRMVEQANQLWRREHLDNLRPEWFESTESMRRYLGDSIVRGNDFDLQVATSLPPGMMETLRALFHYNLRGPRLAIQFAWMPGYDWELTIIEAAGTPDSPGAFTVVVKSRYPRDPHPSTIR